MIRKHLRSLVVLALLSPAIFIAGHKASADIYQPWLQCAQSNGYWSSDGCMYDITITTQPPTGCWFSNTDMQSGHGGGVYDLGKPILSPCSTSHLDGNGNIVNDPNLVGQVLSFIWQDAGNQNMCVQTPPQYAEDNCSVPPLPASLYVNIDSTTGDPGFCPAGGTWSIGPGGFSGSSSSGPMVVYPDAGGATYSFSYTPANGYVVNTLNPATGSTLVFPGNTATFNATCTPPPQRILLSLTATTNPDQCSVGTTLNWSSTYANSCSAAWTSSTATSGSQAVKPTTSPKKYNMTCANDTETKTVSVDVTSSDAINGSCPVTPPPPLTPSVSISASPSSIAPGNSSTITWTGTDVSSCSAFWTDLTTPSGHQIVSPVSTTNYVIVCQGNDRSIVYGSAQVSVTATQAVIFIYSNLSNGGGTISPGGFYGQGTDLSHYGYVTPNATNGTVYTITPNVVSGYTFSKVEDGQGGPDGASALLFPGQSKFFDVIYGQIPPPPPVFTYSLSNSGPNSVTAGASTQEVITKTLTSGTGGSVSLAVSGLPAGVTVTGISGQGCTPNCTSTISFNVDSSVSPGRSLITVTGSPNNVTTQFNLNVNSSANISVSCVPNPAVAKVGQPVIWTATAGGGTGIFTDYQWSGSGIPSAPLVHTANNSYSVTYSTVGTKTTTAIVTDSHNKTGTCQAGTAVVNINPTFQEF